MKAQLRTLLARLAALFRRQRMEASMTEDLLVDQRPCLADCPAPGDRPANWQNARCHNRRVIPR
jgi:hypothetical protein